MPLARNQASRRSTMPLTSAMIRRTTSGSARVPTPATCGSRASGEKVPPPKSSTKNWVSSGVVVSDMLVTIVRSRVLLPLRGPPTTATWPLAPPRLTVRVSRRCSRGRSTVPRGTTSPPSPRHCGDTSPRSGSSVRSPISSSRVSGTSSGGSQTWWAAGPWPTMWSTAMSSRDCWSPGSRAGAGSGSGSVTSRVCTSEIVKGRMPRRWPPSSRRTRARPDGRAGHVGRLEAQQRRRVGLEVAQARDRGELVGVRDPQDRAGLAGAERAQADPVGQVRLEAAEPPLLEPLRGEQQVQPQRPSQAADRDEEVDELGLGREHLGELVHDDEQRGHRLERLAVDPGLLVVADRGEVAGLAQQLLAADHLAGQRVLHAVDERELLGQVRDDRRDVRHLRHPGKGRATLEVDEHHVELLGRVRHREPEHQGAQELRLAGTGRTDHQPVRAHALLGGLLDVEVDDAAALAEADRHPQPVARGTGSPRGGRARRSARHRAPAAP